mmetsp:Transcript_35761/g.89023  ORF Transcript_35761/g.89023 Transcript_35761/m.89023 type:complete len:205 (+) Transcript_35761:982-1596(+)
MGGGALIHPHHRHHIVTRQRLQELVIVDASVFLVVARVDDVLYPGAIEGVPENLPQVLRTDVARLVHIKPLESVSDHGLLQDELGLHRGSQELRVVDLVVASHIHFLEDLPGLCLGYLEHLSHRILQLVQQYGSVLLPVQFEEYLLELLHLIAVHRQGYHPQRRTLHAVERRELLHVFEDVEVDLVVVIGLEALKPFVFERLFS